MLIVYTVSRILEFALAPRGRWYLFGKDGVQRLNVFALYSRLYLPQIER
jgi:hypothetical protein